jgi:hypothetical protein
MQYVFSRLPAVTSVRSVALPTNIQEDNEEDLTADINYSFSAHRHYTLAFRTDVRDSQYGECNFLQTTEFQQTLINLLAPEFYI